MIVAITDLSIESIYFVKHILSHHWMIRAWAGFGWISSGRKTTAPGWLAWVIMGCKYVGEWYSRRGHFVPVNELMSIFEQIWETRKHIHDLKKYPQCRLHEKKSNLQFRSPAWRYGCLRPWIRNQFPENPTKVRVVTTKTKFAFVLLSFPVYQMGQNPVNI